MKITNLEDRLQFVKEHNLVNKSYIEIDEILNKTYPSEVIKILRANTTYKECFTKTIQRGKGKGKLKGFPLCGRCNIQRDCKVRPIQKYMKSLLQDTQQYVGLATDEQDRLALQIR